MAVNQTCNTNKLNAEEIEVELVIYLGDNIYPGSDSLQKTMLHLKQHVKPNIQSISEAFDALKAKGKISLGNYKLLSDVISRVDVRIAQGIKDFEERIQSELGSGGGVFDQQSPPHNSTAESRIPDTDIDLLFDYLSKKLLPSDMLIFATSLLGETQMAETPHAHRNPSDAYFRMMHMWRCKQPTIDHKEKLKEVFSSMDRQDLVEEVDNFSIDDFQYSGTVFEPTKRFSDSDLPILASNLATRYYHVVRFLGVKQRSIDQIEADNPAIREQIYQAFLMIKRAKPTLTRQGLCNALYYADHLDVIDILNSKWNKSS